MRWRTLLLMFLILGLAAATAATAQERAGRRGRPAPAPQSAETPAPQGGVEAAPTEGSRARQRVDARRRRFETGAQTAPADSLMVEAAGRVAYERPASPSRQVAEFNTLTTAVLSPTGEVVLLGTWDPTYATGPIPYAALLRDALSRPEPAFSLDSMRDPQADAAFRQLLDQEAPRIASDTAYGLAWIQRVMDLVWGSAAVEKDRTAFAARFEREFGITRAEFEGFRRWRSQPDAPTTPPEAREFMRKFYTGAGVPEVGTVLSLMNEFKETGDYNLLLRMGQEFGRGPEVQTLVNQILALPAGNARLTPVLELYSILYGELLRRLGAPEGPTRDALAAFRNAGGSETGILAYIDQVSGEYMGDAVGRKILHGFTLSTAVLGQMYPLPPAQARVNTFGAPLDSPMMRVFFHADYRLKGVCADGGPDGLPSDAVFLFEQSGLAMADSVRFRYWLVPDQVQLQASPDGSVVRFGPSRVRLRSELLESTGADAESQAALSGLSERYAGEITSRYDLLARESPSLHTLREAAKVIALARWARDRGVALRVPETGPSGPPLPATVPGLWGATFLVLRDPAQNSLQFWRSGGVSFEQEDASGWVRERPDPTVAPDVLRQLAASTALSERAAAAALGGKMELARELAEQSAQAMVGGPLPAIPEPVMARVASPADEARVSAAALEAVDANVQALESARAELEAAAPLQAGSPAEYQQALESSRQSAARSEENLKKLQGYLAQYRQAPGASGEVAVQLLALRPGALTVAASAPATPGAEAGAAQATPSSAGDPRVALGPTREEMEKELKRLQADLARVTQTQARLTRSMLSDVAQFEAWQADVERGYNRSWDNLQGLVENEILFYAKRYLKLKNAPKADVEAVERLGTAVTLRDINKWRQEQKKDWEWAAKGIVMLAGAAGLDDQLNRVLVAGGGLIDASVDLASYYAAWRGMEQLKGNPAAFEAANAANRKVMEALIARLRELEGRLGPSR